MNDDVQIGIFEAVSYDKGVVKIDGAWLKFGQQAEDAIRNIKKGEEVEYSQANRTLTWIARAQPRQQAQPQRQMYQAQPQRQMYQERKTEYAPDVKSPGMSKDELIVRQVALKAVVELAKDYEFGDTADMLSMATEFSMWMEGRHDGTFTLLKRKEEKKQDGKKPLVKDETPEAMV